MVQVVVPAEVVGAQPRFADAGETGVDLARGTQNERIEVLYRKYARRLRALCIRRLGTADDADDAVHETLLKAARAWPSFRQGSDPWPWLATIATNVCCDLHRTRTRQETTGVPDRVIDVDDTVVASMTSELVRDALGELPELMRTTLALRDLEGWGYEEIATLQGRSLAAVRSTLMRGRRALRDSLGCLAAAGRLPLPAGVPILWRRLRASASRRSASALAIDPSAAFASAGPARAALLAAVLAVGASGLLATGASSSGAAAAESVHADSASVDLPRPVASPEATEVRASAATKDAPSTAPPTPRRLGSVSTAPPPAHAPEMFGATAEVTGPSENATLNGKIVGKTPGGELVSANDVDVDCTYSEVRRFLCDAVDAAPSSP